MKLLLCGDICPTAKNEALFANGDVNALFGNVAALFSGNDLNFANLECALTDGGEPIVKKGPNLRSGTATAATLKALGLDVCGLSNNHVFDFGIEGIADMLAALKVQGIAYTGFGKDYDDARRDFVFEKNGERVTLITVCEHEYSYATEDGMGSRPFDEFDTLEDVRAARAAGGTVVVLYHGGKEFCRQGKEPLRKDLQGPLFPQAGKRSSQEVTQASLLQGTTGLSVPGRSGCQSV